MRAFAACGRWVGPAERLVGFACDVVREFLKKFGACGLATRTAFGRAPFIGVALVGAVGFLGVFAFSQDCEV